MEGLDYWRLCDELSVVQAALLIAGEDPSAAQEFIENWEPDERPIGYEAAKAAISNALRREVITGKLIPIFEYDINGNINGPIDDSIDIKESRIDVDSLRAWLAGRGLSSGFFFPATTETPDYLDPNNPRYAPKLAAAVHAWLATDEGAITKGKSVKWAIDKWIREHAAEFGLADTDGNPINQAIEDCSKVANWNPGGGAPKTPGG